MNQQKNQTSEVLHCDKCHLATQTSPLLSHSHTDMEIWVVHDQGSNIDLYEEKQLELCRCWNLHSKLTFHTRWLNIQTTQWNWKLFCMIIKSSMVNILLFVVTLLLMRQWGGNRVSEREIINLFQLYLWTTMVPWAYESEYDSSSFRKCSASASRNGLCEMNVSLQLITLKS